MPDSFIPDLMKKMEWQNNQLKPRLKEGDDYMLINEDLQYYFIGKYGIKP